MRAEELLRRLARRAQCKQQTLELRAPRAVLADECEVEDLARQVSQVERARQAAKFSDTDTGIVCALTCNQAHGDVRLTEQFREQVGVLPVEVDEDDATGHRMRGISGQGRHREVSRSEGCTDPNIGLFALRREPDA